jgi:hypothetical protein
MKKAYQDIAKDVAPTGYQDQGVDVFQLVKDWFEGE